MPAGAAERSDPVNSLYVVATWVPRCTTIVVGALGPVHFERAWYAYVGSAARARDARVARHLRARRSLRWHADYLFAAHPATQAWLVDTVLTECEVAEQVGRALAPPGAATDGRPDRCPDGCAALPAVTARPAAGFGASDCGCAGHLLSLGRRPSTQVLLAAMPHALITCFSA